MEKHDVVIIGAGIAGSSCALYLKQANVDFVLIGSLYASSLINAVGVYNYLSFSQCDGSNLLMNIEEQFAKCNIRPCEETVVSIIRHSGEYRFSVITSSGNQYVTNNIVIATGDRPRTFGFECEKDYLYKTIHTCAMCDGALYKDKIVAVIGSGNTAVSAVNLLSGIAKKVYFIHRKEKLSASQSNLIIDSKIVNVVSSIENIEHNKDTNCMLVKCSDSQSIEVNGIFYAIGRIPNTKFLNTFGFEEGIGNYDDRRNERDYFFNINGYIRVLNNRTNIKGIYACGDVTNCEFKQAIIAAADGASTALRIINSLK